MNSNLYLKEPSLKDKDEWLRYVLETKEDNPNATPGGFKEDTVYENWCQKIINSSKSINLEEGRVPSSFYFLIDNNRIIGSISIRHSIESDMLKKFGGHIGYNIRPSERKKGYATKMLSLALKKCQELELYNVMITCKKENIGSAKTIENNYGKLKDEIYIAEEDVVFKIYWIDVNYALKKINI